MFARCACGFLITEHPINEGVVCLICQLCGLDCSKDLNLDQAVVQRAKIREVGTSVELVPLVVELLGEVDVCGSPMLVGPSGVLARP